MAASKSAQSVGNDVMMVGLVSQVVTLGVFGIMALDVFFRIRHYNGRLSPSTATLRGSRRLRGLLMALIIAYTTILIRCIYRIAEMAGGWANAIMQNQVAFIILDGL